MSLEVTGKLLVKYDTVVVTEKFKKREFVLELSEEINGNTYTNYAKMQLVQNKCEVIDNYSSGDKLKVSFNIKGTAYTDKKDGVTKYITNLDAWKVEGMVQQYQPHDSRNATNQPPASQAAPAAFSTEAADDLPF